MDTLSQFEITAEQLKADNQQFNYQIGNDFFEALPDAEVKKGALTAVINTKKTTGRVELHLAIDGEITVQCCRCLDEMQLPVHTTDVLTITLGISSDEDALCITPECPSVNIAWNVYEAIALCIPIAPVHAEGECNAEMMAKYSEYAVDNEKKTETDPRWDALKNMSTNN